MKFKASKKKDQQAIQRLNELNNGMDKSESLISRKMEEAKANVFLYGGTQGYLDYERHQAIASNSKVYFGELPPTIWTANSMGLTDQINSQ